MRHIRYFSIFIIRFRKNDFPHFTLAETVAQRNNVTRPGSHSQYVRSHHLNPGLDSRAQSLSILPQGLQRGCSQNMFGLWFVPKCVTQCLKERNAVLLRSNRLCSFHEDRLSTTRPTLPHLSSLQIGLAGAWLCLAQLPSWGNKAGTRVATWHSASSLTTDPVAVSAFCGWHF